MRRPYALKGWRFQDGRHNSAAYLLPIIKIRIYAALAFTRFAMRIDLFDYKLWQKIYSDCSVQQDAAAVFRQGNGCWPSDSAPHKRSQPAD